MAKLSDVLHGGVVWVFGLPTFGHLESQQLQNRHMCQVHCHQLFKMLVSQHEQVIIPKTTWIRNDLALCCI